MYYYFQIYILKYKHFKGRQEKAEKWLSQVKQREPRLFIGWLNFQKYWIDCFPFFPNMSYYPVDFLWYR